MTSFDLGPTRSARMIAVGPGLKAKVHVGALRGLTLLGTRILHGRGLGRAVDFMALALGSDSYALFEVFGSRKLRVPLSDRYWMPPLMRTGTYEPEVMHVLSHLLSPDHGFLDCGANIGWWSLYASTVIADPHRIIAIEASPTTYQRLEETAALNGEAFRCINAAVWSESGLRLPLRIDPRRHSRASVSAKPVHVRRSERVQIVESVRIDQLVASMLPAEGKLIVKLDVEGGELKAIEGMQGCLARADLVIYEDHGKYQYPAVTRSLLDHGYTIFGGPREGRISRLRSQEAVQAIKSIRRRGYNFFAVRPSSDLEAQLELLASAPIQPG